ncbi:hypothetical protein [Kitasatospora sp. GP82]|uniref:hypothetical protein n=1 Tax=Kitasatospora sp. GP82 TaxID=3035089 RepID=UPI002473F873|nr:hypothetical protein [Kitasatospora sp. GP82]MDH6130372.1 hypothetical protein [Kitasatospora sp. GP82]
MNGYNSSGLKTPAEITAAAQAALDVWPGDANSIEAAAVLAELQAVHTGNGFWDRDRAIRARQLANWMADYSQFQAEARTFTAAVIPAARIDDAPIDPALRATGRVIAPSEMGVILDDLLIQLGIDTTTYERITLMEFAEKVDWPTFATVVSLMKRVAKMTDATENSERV